MVTPLRPASVLAALCAVGGLLLSGPVAADALRCGSRLVSPGDARSVVIARCGQPADVVERTRLAAPVVWRHGRPWRVAGGDIEVRIEEWTYNFGPLRFMRRVRFEDGIVVAIDTLGYGYRPDQRPSP